MWKVSRFLQVRWLPSNSTPSSPSLFLLRPKNTSKIKWRRHPNRDIVSLIPVSLGHYVCFIKNYVKCRNAKDCEINCRLASPLSEVAPPVIIPSNLLLASAEMSPQASPPPQESIEWFIEDKSFSPSPPPPHRPLPSASWSLSHPCTVLHSIHTAFPLQDVKKK